MVLKKMKTTTLAVILALIPCLSRAELVVIANRNTPVTSLSQEEIYRIYLAKSKFLPNGVKIIPVDQRPGTASREKFYSEVIRRSETEMKTYWSRLIFTGQGNPPIQEADDQSVKDLVAKNPNFMGYIDKVYADDSVKVIFSQP